MPIRTYAPPKKRVGKVGRPRTATTALVPAAARVAEPRYLTPEELSLNGEAVETFSKAVGGREALIGVLSVASSAPEIEQIVNHLLDHRYARYSLRRLCTLHGISVADLFTAYRKAMIAKAHVEATHIIASKLPPIVADVMTRAAPQEIACGCVGKERKTCLICHGTGVTLTTPDLDRQKLALELGHLTEKKAGLIVQQNQGVMTGGGAALVAQGSGALEQLQQAVGELLFSPARRRAASPIAAGPILDPPSEPFPLPREDPPAPPAGRPPQEDPDDPDDPDVQEDDEEEDDDPGTAMH